MLAIAIHANHVLKAKFECQLVTRLHGAAEPEVMRQCQAHGRLPPSPRRQCHRQTQSSITRTGRAGQHAMDVRDDRAMAPCSLKQGTRISSRFGPGARVNAQPPAWAVIQ